MFSYFPSFILDSLVPKERFSLHNLVPFDLQQHCIGSIKRHSIAKHQYTRDDLLISILSDSGLDIDALRLVYDLTPIDASSVYKDFSKYLVHKDWVYSPRLYSQFEKGAFYFANFKLQNQGRFHIINYDEVLEYLDKSKSATAFWSTSCHKKKEVLEHPDWPKSYVLFLYRYLRGEPVYVPCYANQKEEIREFIKLQENKIRSFVIGSIYALILNHSVNYDHDISFGYNWLKNRIGMGMSIFQNDYHNAFIPLLHRKKYYYRDTSKWDAGQHHFVRECEVDTLNYLCHDNTTSFYELLGSLKSLALELGLEDFKCDARVIRHRLLMDESFGPVVMPYGEILTKNRGKNSGDGRTTAQNCGVHKIVEFAAASKFYNYQEFFETYLTKYYELQTGDDQVGGGPDTRIFDEENSLMKQIGYEVESVVTDNFYDIEYLSTTPVMVSTARGNFLAPSVNITKICASLCFKTKSSKPIDCFQRLMSAILLCRWSEDYPVLKTALDQFLEKYPQFRDSAFYKSDSAIVSLYFGY